MKIERLVIGSNNPAKIDEWKKQLGEVIDIISVAELGDFPEPKESGSTFAENAAIKAIHYALLSQNIVLADDAGFEIDALNGEPGVKSRRILPGGKEGTDQECVDYVLKRMKNVPKEKRTARLVAHVAVSDKEGNIIYKDHAERGGFITESLMDEVIPGFPYRSLLYIPEAGKVYSQLTEEEHEKLNHRKKIAEKLIGFLKG